jgi:hypothetical protein
VPASKGLSSILGIQTIEFLVKVIGGVGAVIYLVTFVPTPTWNKLFPQSIAGINLGLIVAVLGIALMLIGAIVLAAFTWSKRAISLFDRIANSRYLKRFTGGLMGKLEEYKESSHSTRRAIPEIVILTMGCWILKGLEWYFLGLALGITQIPWIAYFDSPVGNRLGVCSHNSGWGWRTRIRNHWNLGAFRSCYRSSRRIRSTRSWLADF